MNFSGLRLQGAGETTGIIDNICLTPTASAAPNN